MAHLMTNLGELARGVMPVMAGVLLWSYLAVAVVYGTLSI